jgi:hypothetical protein
MEIHPRSMKSVESRVDFFMDLGWLSMDLAWKFNGFHGSRVDFHGDDIDE